MDNIDNNNSSIKSNCNQEESTKNSYLRSFYKWIFPRKPIQKEPESVFTRLLEQIEVVEANKFVQEVIENEEAGIVEILKALDTLGNKKQTSKTRKSMNL